MTIGIDGCNKTDPVRGRGRERLTWMAVRPASHGREAAQTRRARHHPAAVLVLANGHGLPRLGPARRPVADHPLRGSCTITIDVGVAKAGTGAPQGDRSQGANYILNTITPATRATSHYFWATVRNYHLKDQRITTLLREGVARVFSEDEAMIEAQQRAINENSGYELYNLNIDAGGMWARRAIDAMIDREVGSPGGVRDEPAPAASGEQ